MTRNTHHSQPAPTPLLFPRTPAHSHPPSVPMKWTICANSRNTNKASLSMIHTKDASRPPEQKSFKPLIPNGSQAFAANAWASLTTHPSTSSTTHSNDATLDNLNIQELISTMDNAWNPTKSPATKFEHDDKIEQQLEKVSIQADSQHCLALFKAAVKCTGTFDPVIREWEAKPKSDKTFTKVHPCIIREFSKNNTCKLTAQAAGYGITNHVDTITPFTHDTANLVLATIAELVNAISAQNDKNWTTSSNSK
ncbi:hypothetical protein ACHAW6_015928 [Cyclotella cf. meneghiniana]